MASYSLLFLVLLPVFCSAGFLGLGDDPLKDNELETYMSMNKNSLDLLFNAWGNHQYGSTLYTYELASPQQEPVKQGLVFASDFSQKYDTKDMFLKSSLTTPKGKKSVYVLPYRNMQKIYCNANLRNKIEFYANNTRFDYWLDMWESDCRTLANYFDTNRVARQAKLSEVVGQMSAYADTYIQSQQEFNKFESKTASNVDSISVQQSNIQVTVMSISHFTNESSNKIDEISQAEKKNAEFTTKAEDIKGEIEQDGLLIETLQGNIDEFETQSSGHEENKKLYDENAENSLKRLEELIELLKVEAPGDSELDSVVQLLKKEKDLEGFEKTVRSILPA